MNFEENELINASFLKCEGQLQEIFISPRHKYLSKNKSEFEHSTATVREVECVAGRGLYGDRYYNKRPGHKGQVTFFQAETVDAIQVEFGLIELQPHLFRRNLIVRGIELRELLGKQFEFQQVIFEGVEECKPCVWMDRVIAAGVQHFMRDQFRGGLRARILTDGRLRIT